MGTSASDPAMGGPGHRPPGLGQVPSQSAGRACRERRQAGPGPSAGRHTVRRLVTSAAGAPHVLG